MANHPNRSGKHPSRNPTPEEIKAAREAAQMTSAEAGALVHSTESKWREWESGARRMHPAFFELFNIKVKGQSKSTNGEEQF
jgi:putative transcriptional regulator